MLARSRGICLASSSILRRPLPQNSIRSYALSRFPDRGTGFGRNANRKSARESKGSSNQNSPLNYEEESSAEASQLWESSQRSPASNPEEALQRLLMRNDTLVITRQIEMLNIFVGFEQSNKYVISNEAGEPLGYVAEEPRGFFSIFARQLFRTHRPFRALVMDLHGSPILWIRRPFAWINSRMFVQRLKDFQDCTADGEPVLDTFAEVQQEWHPWRRRYDLFIRDKPRRILSLVSESQPEPPLESFSQFSRVDEGLFAWYFNMLDARGSIIATINRAFRGFGREIFTDTGQYFVSFRVPPTEASESTTPTTTIVRDLTLNERALVLAMAVNIDFDYFSRHSQGGHGLGIPMWWGSGE
ncbi:Scramblase-domain-containing protein [Hygrophoropsis aurantiaca]|uniref:Scramblase-domain-containing protein n=1 Tax=Hygrophoropsis aurantiaca TaxID=72124 RepID=A0ACB8A871_9AGAM|nr:Scramblase-domain-containing protein [Hygrophoropsis aurantiaca]